MPLFRCVIYRLLAGIVFVVFGIIPFLRKEKNDKVSFKQKRSSLPLIASFSLIAFMELGDKTQILTIMLAAQSSPIPVLVGMFLAFALLTGAAVLIGAKLVSRLPGKWLRVGTSTLFLALGTFSILSGILQFSLF